MRRRGCSVARPRIRAVSVRVLPVAVVVLVSLALPTAVAAVGGSYAAGHVSDRAAARTTGVVEQQAQPSATIQATPDPASPSEPVTLDASGSSSPNGQITSCDFDYEGDGNFDVFGDGDCVVTHSYAQAGSYQPTVRARDEVQQADTASTTLTVAQNQPPDAAFQPTPTDPSVGEPVTFDAIDSNDPDGSIVEYRWDFDGDGTTDAVEADPVATHAYDDPGTYAPVLTVEDDDGATDEAVYQSITVAANQPPTARFDYTPSEPEVGESTTFDASASSDPDGEVVEYRWDFDDDGTVDEATGDPTTTHAFADAGTHVVALVVEDDDGATDAAQDQAVTVTTTGGGGPIARCSLSTTSAGPGQSVTLDAANSANAASAAFDVDGDGTFDRTVESPFRTTATYEPGTYSPRVRVTGPNGQTDETVCGTITVGGENQPPVARFDYQPADPETDAAVRFDASDSYDPDGEVVTYRWDFDADGVVDATTDGPTVEHAFPDEAGYLVVLEVEDDDGATDDTSNPVEVQSGTPGGGGFQWQWGVLVLVGLLGGLGLCRGLAWLRPFRRGPRIAVPAGSGVTDYAAGVVALPAEGGTVAVDDVGFEPDLLLLTASNAVVAGDATDQVRGTADGWSYGAARRTADGEVDQQVVAVADDARRPTEAVAAAHGDRAVHLATNGGDGHVGGGTGRVERTTPDGFELSADVPGGSSEANEPNGPAGAAIDRPVVLYRAFVLDSPGDVEIGHFTTSAEPGPQSVDLGVPADHVTLTACNALVEAEASATVDGPVCISVGEVAGTAEGDVVGAEAPRQLVTAGAIVPGVIDATVAAASDRLAIDLLDGGDGGTRARATRLDGGLELDYETVGAGATAGQSTEPGTGGSPALVSYVAMHAGAAARPAIGHFALPSPAAEDDLAVDTGFAPGMVELTVVDVAELGERTAVASPFAFGRSHGVAVRGADGAVEQHRLSGAVDLDRPVDAVDVADRALEFADRSDEGSDALADDASREVLVADAAAAGLAADGAGETITGRDDVAVTAFRATGFDVRVTDVSTDGRDPEAGSDKLVCYKAWPRVDR